MTLEEAFKKYEGKDDGIWLRRKNEIGLDQSLRLARAFKSLQKAVEENIDWLNADDWEVVK